MRLDNPLLRAGRNDEAYDEIYWESWQQALKKCEGSLERHDREHAVRVKSLQHFRDELKGLLADYPDEQSTKAIMLIYPTLDHYETFAKNFVDMMAKPVDTSMMWGLLFLVFGLALELGSSNQSSGPLSRITRWLEKIGHKLRVSNDCNDSITNLDKVKGDTVENIEEAIKRIEKVAEIAQRQARLMNDMEIYQRLLSLENSSQEGATLPCNTLPVAENKLFFGRDDILRELEEHLTPADTASRLSSIAIYGLGGIGKTQIALAYAYQKLDELDAVLWISAEDTYSIQQSFSRVAVDALKLPKAHTQAYAENMILVLDWLQKTSSKWLLIFDNVDSHDVLDNCWPASKHGAVLVTTRDVVVAALPIDRGLEVNEFGSEEGAEFLLHMASNRRRIDNEIDAARHVARQLGGLPLALNQMAALINARSCTVEEFEAMYTKYDQRMHKQKKSGWKYLGYKHGLDTVWEISFANLGPDAKMLLGVLSFFSPDLVPSEVFTTTMPGGLPEPLSFCEDELSFSDALEELTHHALVRKNVQQNTFRIHRLVQAEFRSRMESPQESFEAATRVLLDKFPSERSNQYDDDEWIMYERYIPQVLSLARNYNESQTKATPLKPSSDFVRLLTNAANAIHDNDTTNVVSGLLSTADSAFHKSPQGDQDELLWAFVQSLKCMHHLTVSDFARAEAEMTEGLEIRKRLLPTDDLLLALAYSWLGMAVAAQGRLEEGLQQLLEAGKVLEGPAGEVPTRRLVWGYNIARNYYCMDRFDEAERLLTEALADADNMQSWYMQVYGHLTFTSLYTRMDRLDDAKRHVDKAEDILETSGIAARFSWLSSYCAYRSGDVAMKQGRVQEAIKGAERATAIGKLVKVPRGILSRCTHAYSKALAMDPARQEESEVQRREARMLRSQVPGGGGDLDDESDEAFEQIVKMDHR